MYNKLLEIRVGYPDKISIYNFIHGMRSMRDLVELLVILNLDNSENIKKCSSPLHRHNDAYSLTIGRYNFCFTGVGLDLISGIIISDMTVYICKDNFLIASYSKNDNDERYNFMSDFKDILYHDGDESIIEKIIEDAANINKSLREQFKDIIAKEKPKPVVKKQYKPIRQNSEYGPTTFRSSASLEDLYKYAEFAKADDEWN